MTIDHLTLAATATRVLAGGSPAGVQHMGWRWESGHNVAETLMIEDRTYLVNIQS